MSKSVPAWPVIGLSYDGDTAVADPAGVGDPIRVAAYPDLATAAASAAAAAARRLNVSRCRVQGVSPDGEVWMLVIDAETETLEELAPSSAPRAGARGLRGRFSTGPQRWWLVAGVAAVAAVAVAVAVIPRVLLDPGAQTPTAQEAPTPPAGQLPVSAPAGWDTYASAVIDAAKPGAAAVLAGDDTLVLADGGDVVAVNAATGQERWRAGTPADITALYAPAGGDVIYAARGNTGVAVIDTNSGEVITTGDTVSEEIVLGDVPFARLPGQAGAVLDGTTWERRQVPATAVPVGTVGEGLVSVSVEQSALWVTTSDSPVLPASVALAPPSKEFTLARVATLVDGHLVLEWTSRTGTQAFTVDRVVVDGTVSREATYRAVTRSSAQATIDPAAGLVGIGPVLLDLRTMQFTESQQGNVRVSAGYGWTEQAGGERVRISPVGETLPLAVSAVIPDVVLPDGRAVVRAARGSDGNAYYLLEESQPSATPTPSPTDERDRDGND